jgi:autophagy-related protein 16
MAEPAWQETLRLRLVERNTKESAFAAIIEQCKSSNPLISRLADFYLNKT